MEDLTNIWNNLSLPKRENTGLVLQNDQRTGEFILAEKFLTTHFLNMEVMAQTFKQLWQSTNSFKIRHWEATKFYLYLTILKNQPWNFDKQLMVPQRNDTNTLVHTLIFNKVPFWVKVHNIPIRYYRHRILYPLRLEPHSPMMLNSKTQCWFRAQSEVKLT